MKDTTNSHANDPLVLAAMEGSWKKVEALWLERLDDSTASPSLFLEVASLVAGGKKTDLLRVLASMTAPALIDRGESDSVLSLAKIAAAARVDDSDLVEATLGAARRVYSEHSACEALVTRADLERGRGLSHVLTLFKAFFRFDVGDLARHTGG
ncbi:MAG: hypothetical protein ACYTFG_10450, partial [Planctomycetota bacterium]